LGVRRPERQARAGVRTSSEGRLSLTPATGQAWHSATRDRRTFDADESPFKRVKTTTRSPTDDQLPTALRTSYSQLGMFTKAKEDRPTPPQV
jgi:hypothetical protein